MRYIVNNHEILASKKEPRKPSQEISLLEKFALLGVNTFFEIQMSHWTIVVSRRYCKYRVVSI